MHGYISIILNRLVALQSAPWQVHLLMREILQPTEACRMLVHDYFRPFLKGLTQLIGEIVQCKLPEEKQMQLAFSIVGQCMYYRFAGDVASMVIENEGLSENSFDIDSLAEHITEFSLGAMYSIGKKYCEVEVVDAKKKD